MARWVEALATELDGMDLISGTYECMAIVIKLDCFLFSFLAWKFHW